MTSAHARLRVPGPVPSGTPRKNARAVLQSLLPTAQQADVPPRVLAARTYRNRCGCASAKGQRPPALERRPAAPSPAPSPQPFEKTLRRSARERRSSASRSGNGQ